MLCLHCFSHSHATTGNHPRGLGSTFTLTPELFSTPPVSLSASFFPPHSHADDCRFGSPRPSPHLAHHCTGGLHLLTPFHPPIAQLCLHEAATSSSSPSPPSPSLASHSRSCSCRPCFAVCSQETGYRRISVCLCVRVRQSRAQWAGLLEPLPHLFFFFPWRCNLTDFFPRRPVRRSRSSAALHCIASGSPGNVL